MSNEAKFTDEQIRDWREYERVRLSGRLNMFDPGARYASGLTGEAYKFCMNNYSALAKAAMPESHDEQSKSD